MKIVSCVAVSVAATALAGFALAVEPGAHAVSGCPEVVWMYLKKRARSVAMEP